METVADRVKKQMIKRGMSADQADAALNEVMPCINEMIPGYEIWSQPANSYPVSIYALIWANLEPLILNLNEKF